MGNLSADVYFIADTVNNTFHYLSPAFEAIWELNADAVKKNPKLLLDSVRQEDRIHVRSCYLDLLENGRGNNFEFRIITPGGTEKYIRISIFILSGQNQGDTIAGIAEDFSVIRRNIFYMEKINARKNSMLEILAHDLKGPIGTINMLASSIRQEAVDAQNVRVLEAAKYIQDICKRNITLIRNLVNAEFLESAEVDLRKERADLVWEINDVIQNYKRSEDVLLKTFVLTSSAGNIYLEIDSLKFIQVINNLISNAIKFTYDNGIITVDIKDQGDHVLITVSDNGIGIPEHLQLYLFDKFTRARRTGLRGEEPVGLGMSIIKTIVEMHGGRIWFDSRENQGTNFYIALPKA